MLVLGVTCNRPGPGHRWTNAGSFEGSEEISQVPGQPFDMHAPLYDPGGATDPTTRPAVIAFRPNYVVGPHEAGVSGLSHAACMLPVYASRLRSPGCAQHAVPDGGQPFRVGISPTELL